jgi:hypothetical protein
LKWGVKGGKCIYNYLSNQWQELNNFIFIQDCDGHLYTKAYVWWKEVYLTLRLANGSLINSVLSNQKVYSTMGLGIKRFNQWLDWCINPMLDALWERWLWWHKTMMHHLQVMRDNQESCMAMKCGKRRV